MMLSSLILRTAMRLLLPLILAFAMYLTLKGHNDPGGGFIGGMVAATALALYRLSLGREAFYRLIPLHPRLLIALGLSLATATAILPLFWGRGVLRSVIREVVIPGTQVHVHLASAMIFDLGVLLVVIGVAMGMILRLSAEVERSEADGAAGDLSDAFSAAQIIDADHPTSAPREDPSS